MIESVSDFAELIYLLLYPYFNPVRHYYKTSEYFYKNLSFKTIKNIQNICIKEITTTYKPDLKERNHRQKHKRGNAALLLWKHGQTMTILQVLCRLEHCCPLCYIFSCGPWSELCTDIFPSLCAPNCWLQTAGMVVWEICLHTS